MSAQLGRDEYLELRARYLRLLDQLRRTQPQNPETLKALERILGPEQGDGIGNARPGFSGTPRFRVVRHEFDSDTGEHAA